MPHQEYRKAADCNLPSDVIEASAGVTLPVGSQRTRSTSYSPLVMWAKPHTQANAFVGIKLQCEGKPVSRGLLQMFLGWSSRLLLLEG